MQLYGSTRSPFVRKVLIVAHETGTIGEIVMRPTAVTMTMPNPALLAVNPLRQVPTLVLDDGQALYDSAVICRYLDLVRGKALLHPREPAAEIAMMRRLALGDGLIAVLLGLLSEQSRKQPEQSDLRTAVLQQKLPRIFETLEAAADDMARTPFDMAQVAIAAALCYADFRLSRQIPWRDGHPRLARWFAAVEARRSVAATAYFDEQEAARRQDQEKQIS